MNIKKKYNGFCRKGNCLVFYFHLRTGFKAKNVPTLACQVPLSIGINRQNILLNSLIKLQ